MKTEKIVEDVGLLLGAPSSLSLPDVSPCSEAFRRRVLLETEECAAEVISEMATDALSGWLPLPDDALQTDGNGGYLLPLPDDFLRLHSVRMSHWEADVTHIFPSDHWLAPLQTAATEALRATPERPLGFMGISAEGKRALRLYGGEEEDAHAMGWYLAAPKIDAAGEIEIPPAAYIATITLIAKRMAEKMSFT